jgi:hypothetical protein
MTILDLALVSSIMAVPIISGALKDMSSSGTVRALIKIVAPIAGIFPLCYLFYTLLQAAGVQTSFDFSQSASYGAIALVLFAGVSYFISLRIVRFGEEIARQEGSGVRHDISNVTEQAWAIMEPKLQEHESKVEAITKETFDKKMKDYTLHFDQVTNNMSSTLRFLKDAFAQNTASNVSLASANKEMRQELDELRKEHKDSNGLSFELMDLCNKLDEKIAIAEAKAEALDSIMEQQGQKTQQPQDQEINTILTPQDGMANRTIGIEAQHEMARYLGEIGFDIKESHGAGEADYILRKDNEIVAIGSNKAYTLYDEPKRMQRRISSKDVEPEIILAKKLQMPLIVFVTNRRNSRRWACIIKYDELSEWTGVSTPVMLAKDDESSGRILQEEFASVLAGFGAVV